jgi:hypothetical protein
MSFVGRLFTRKGGGTRVGNLLRQVAYDNTYGLLGKNISRDGTSEINSHLPYGQFDNSLKQ